MPKLWNETIEEHRHAVRQAALDAAAAVVAESGPAAVTMTRIAERTGIGRATLYKYFPDSGAILLAWHERQIAAHLQHLAEIRDRPGTPGNRLRAVLEAYALLSRTPHGSGPAALLHQGAHVGHAQQHLLDFLRTLIAEGAETGELRADVPAEELANYCLHALAAAGSMPSEAAVRRLVTVTLAGLRA